MKNLLFTCICAIAIVSCQEKKETVVENSNDSLGVFQDTPSVADSTLAASTTCYMEVTGKDSLFAQIDDNVGTISGKLRYKNFEKDSSYGDVMGIASGDTLKVTYTFQAEGTTSNREIWFLRKDGKLLEGIGPYDETGEKYASAKQVKFENGHALTQADCSVISSKLVP